MKKESAQNKTAGTLAEAATYIGGFTPPKVPKTKLWTNHYEYLNSHFTKFVTALGIDSKMVGGLIVAHGDKCSGYEEAWDAKGIPFYRGVAIYLLTYIHPYSKEVRAQQDGTFIKPYEWVIHQNATFQPILQKIEDEDLSSS